MNPFLKWPGSKRSVADKIFRHVPKQGNVYCEPFAGSCALALHTQYEHYFINDINADLITMLRFAATEPEEFIYQSRPYFSAQNHDAERYYALRDEYNASDCARTRALLLHYLSRFGYNGLVRYNRSGEFNVPVGRYRRLPYFPESEIHQFADKLQSATFTAMPFESFLAQRFESATIVCDPPYIPLNATASFTAYAPVPMADRTPHDRLNALCLTQAQQGNNVYVCNHRIDCVDQYYPDAQYYVNYFAKRHIAANAKKRKQIKETLLYYPSSLGGRITNRMKTQTGSPDSAAQAKVA
ncbi:DNA adenine methylase [Alteromonas macleodii]|uniref:Site-specific DNA-methyltransferase (adenine-specific) n=1 Tax=Alteromonas macleodii TaxID=28108 RepID=A0AB36FNA7_ALTMA|nr:Dam family site-specific DNA-(adenine-N6)-methyltransferase [Alteromonas macleodii]OES24186.1 DNA adenine methylase family protein [Alteromonas macleodii]OES24819.1 DNA adenine methylase family protein [Alteromonas macleodii]OES25097.1 DNA adenine methylase family protein [Alteromonas macleodii]OES39140.1 DNA adenine methylase family protein [Alteromonas macleodii]